VSFVRLGHDDNDEARVLRQLCVCARFARFCSSRPGLFRPISPNTFSLVSVAWLALTSASPAILIKFCIVEIRVAFFVCTYLWIETRPSLFVCQKSRDSSQKELTDVKECFLAGDLS
jgi:hypothetical protein